MGAVLVTDGEQRAALAVVRSLGRAGHTVHVCAARPRPLAGASRHAATTATVPDPLAAPEAFVEAIERLVTRRDIDLLLPITDAACMAILPRRHRFARASVPFPAWDAWRAVSDKGVVMEAAASAGIAVPATHHVASPREWTARPRSDLSFPLVIKPTRSIVEVDGARARLGVRHACDADELASHLASLPAGGFPVLLQQRIVGPGIGAFLLLWDGQVLASFCHRRLRERPPSGGVSVARESIAPDPDLLARSAALLERVGWRGVAMVEYKRDQATGTPYLMEVNGRFWGSLQLAIDAGVDFPALLAAAACGRIPAPVSEYRVGVRSHWWWGEVDHLLARLAGRDVPPPPNGATNPAGRAGGRARGPRRSEVLRLDDPRPFLRETLDWLAPLVRRPLER